MAGDDCFDQESELQMCSSLLCKDVTIEKTNGLAASSTPRDQTEHTKLPAISKVQWLAVAILCYVNLVNFMDQYIPAGEIPLAFVYTLIYVLFVTFGHRL